MKKPDNNIMDKIEFVGFNWSDFCKDNQYTLNEILDSVCDDEPLFQETYCNTRVPSRVVKNWHQSAYLTRPVPSIGYRYTGLFLSLCGYCFYVAYDKDKKPHSRGLVRFFPRNGEIGMMAFRLQSKAEVDGTESWINMPAIFRPLFSAIHDTKAGTALSTVYYLNEQSDNIYENRGALVKILETAHENEGLVQKPIGCFRINIRELESELKSDLSGKFPRFTARYSRLYYS